MLSDNPKIRIFKDIPMENSPRQYAKDRPIEVLSMEETRTPEQIKADGQAFFYKMTGCGLMALMVAAAVLPFFYIILRVMGFAK